MTWLDLSVTALAVIAVILGMRRANRASVRAARFDGACSGVEQVSNQLAALGQDNGWVVGQTKGGLISVIPYSVPCGLVARLISLAGLAKR